MTPLPLSPTELAAWLRLAFARGLKPAALRALLGAFGLPHHLFAQPFHALAAAAGAEAARAALDDPGPDFAAQLDVLESWRAAPGNAIVTLADPAYPPRLLAMPDPPLLLYVKGRLDLLHARSVAVVGSRNATPQALEDATRFSRALAASGITVVSGLALGVDGAAHRGALDQAGRTVAVIGTGADLVYPAAHHALATQIAALGAIVSEWPLGTPARSANFPQRNRVIAALVEGVIVVEAAQRSGSLITARLANEMGRDVFALPGSIHAPLTRGCHGLIKQGAQLVETPADVLEALRVATPGRTAPAAPRRPREPKQSIFFDVARSPRGVTLPLAFDDATAPANDPPASANSCANSCADARANACANSCADARANACADTARARPRTAGSEKRTQPRKRHALSRDRGTTPAAPHIVETQAGEQPPSSEARPASLGAQAQRLLDALGYAPATLEILAERTDMAEAVLQATLLQLELGGHLHALPGGRFVRASH
ncbi:DNA-processing protein DprA [Paraburkholderia acidisoli]|uniref:DNA-protecting protein DprA n=1 Tax=Paraburkholderia acidisoli TaxID=2571748 RepID=A0A7Z2GJ85_9BURK|nr:DNA-processing protein DprA [Paraburkholderia acidisoli]QGZ62805.1 DNA-protecting protein DprA [Paraburkholderia acidisoli]